MESFSNGMATISSVGFYPHTFFFSSLTLLGVPDSPVPNTDSGHSYQCQQKDAHGYSPYHIGRKSAVRIGDFWKHQT